MPEENGLPALTERSMKSSDLGGGSSSSSAVSIRLRVSGPVSTDGLFADFAEIRGSSVESSGFVLCIRARPCGPKIALNLGVFSDSRDPPAPPPN